MFDINKVMDVATTEEAAKKAESAMKAMEIEVNEGRKTSKDYNDACVARNDAQDTALAAKFLNEWECDNAIQVLAQYRTGIVLPTGIVIPTPLTEEQGWEYYEVMRYREVTGSLEEEMRSRANQELCMTWFLIQRALKEEKWAKKRNESYESYRRELYDARRAFRHHLWFLEQYHTLRAARP